MKKPFETRDVLRKSSLGLIKHFYASFGVQVVFAGKSSFAKNIDLVLEKHRQAPQSVQQKIEEEVRRIALLSCRRGIEILQPMVPSLSGIPWDYFFSANATYVQKTMWIWLSYRPIFNEALDLLQRRTAARLAEQSMTIF